MGIAGFYAYLRSRNKYRAAFKRFKPRQCNILAFDLNGLIHKVAQQVFGYGASEDDVEIEIYDYNNTIIISEEELESRKKRLIREVWLELIALVREIGPTDQVIVAVDGVAPQAKITQQRRRRFRSATERPREQVFDSNSITPGTVLMDEIHTFLYEKLESVIEDEQLKSVFPPVINYSSYLTDGEGEHKIADVLRQLGTSAVRTRDMTIVIDGLDADLFMIYMLQLHNFADVVLRRSDHEYLSLAAIGLNSPNDFVIKACLVGNDFIPKMPAFAQVDTYLDYILDEDSRLPSAGFGSGSSRAIPVIVPEGGTTVPGKVTSETGDIDWLAFRNWLTALQPFYDRQLQTWATADTIGIASDAVNIVQSYGSVSAYQKKFNKVVFDDLWFKHIVSPVNYKTATVTEQDKQLVALKYLQGIVWVYTYYRNGPNAVDKTWFYPFHYGPSNTSYLLNFVKDNLDEMQILTISQPMFQSLSMVEQLMMVLPPRSYTLLPEDYHFLMLNSQDSPIYDLYPETIVIDNTGGVKEHEAIVLVPLVDPPSRVKAALHEFNLEFADTATDNFQFVDIKRAMASSRGRGSFSSSSSSSSSRGRGGRGGRGRGGRGTFASYNTGRAAYRGSETRGRGSSSSRGGQSTRGSYAPSRGSYAPSRGGQPSGGGSTSTRGSYAPSRGSYAPSRGGQPSGGGSTSTRGGQTSEGGYAPSRGASSGRGGRGGRGGGGGGQAAAAQQQQATEFSARGGRGGGEGTGVRGTTYQRPRRGSNVNY